MFWRRGILSLLVCLPFLASRFHIFAGETGLPYDEGLADMLSEEGTPEMARRFGYPQTRLSLVPAKGFGSSGIVLYAIPNLTFVERRGELGGIEHLPKRQSWPEVIHRVWLEEDMPVRAELKIRYFSERIEALARELLSSEDPQAADLMGRTKTEGKKLAILPFPAQKIIITETTKIAGRPISLSKPYIDDRSANDRAQNNLTHGNPVILEFEDLPSFELFCDKLDEGDVEFSISYTFIGNNERAATMRTTANIDVGTVIEEHLSSNGMTPDKYAPILQNIARDIASQVYGEMATMIETDDITLIPYLRPTFDIMTTLFTFRSVSVEQLTIPFDSESVLYKQLEPWVIENRNSRSETKVYETGDSTEKESVDQSSTQTTVSGGASVAVSPFRVMGTGSRTSTKSKMNRVADKTWELSDEGNVVTFTEGESGFKIKSVNVGFLKKGKETLSFNDFFSVSIWNRRIGFAMETGFSPDDVGATDANLENIRIEDPLHRHLDRQIEGINKKIDERIDKLSDRIESILSYFMLNEVK